MHQWTIKPVIVVHKIYSVIPAIALMFAKNYKFSESKISRIKCYKMGEAGKLWMCFSG